MAVGLLKKTVRTSAMTLLSRVFGLFRDILIARLFGSGIDAFLIAFRLPNFLRRLFAEGALAQACVPVLSEYRMHRSITAVRALLTRLSLLLGGGLVLLCIIGILAAPLLVLIFAPGLRGDERFEQAVQMLRITFPFLPLISLTALAGAALNAWGRFAAPAFTPVLFNLSLIGCALWLAPKLTDPVHALAWGVLLSGLVSVLFLLPFLRRLNLLPGRGLGSDQGGVRRIFRLMLPACFGVSIAQINSLVDTLIASFLTPGSISWLYYADRLMEFPLGVFGIALSTVILPYLSVAQMQDDPGTRQRILDWALRWGLLIGLPAAIGLMMLAEPAVITLFQYDRFSAEDAELAAAALGAYLVGLPGLILVRILAAVCFSRQDTATPVRVGAVALFANLLLNLLLVGFLQHVGLALATSLAALLNAGLLYLYLRRNGLYQPQPGWIALFLRIALACLIIALALWWLVPAAELWLQWSVGKRVFQLAGWILAGMLLYALLLPAFGLRLAQLRENI